MRVGFKKFFWMVHQELRKTTYLNVKDVGMHYMKTVCDVVAGLQGVLHQDQALTETTQGISEPNEHAAKSVQNT